jgi:hypothetical protein
VRQAIGIEVDEIKCMKSESVIREAYKVAAPLMDTAGTHVPLVLHRDIEQAWLFPCLTPAYIFFTTSKVV